MNRQRGFGMLFYIIGGIVLLAMLGGIIYSVRHWCNDACQNAKDEIAGVRAELEVARIDIKTAVDANLTLQKDVVRIDAERQACSAGVAEQGKLQAQAEAEKARLLASAAASIRTLKGDAAAMTAILNQAARPGVTCAETMANTDSTLRELAVRRLRDHAPNAGSGRSADPATGAGTRPNTLRVAP